MFESDNNSILKKARIILNKLGHSIYIDNDIYDKYHGEVFKYDDLEIFQDINNNLSIMINNEIVFSYNSNANSIKRTSGEWVELIITIYEEIPEILNKRKIKDEKLTKKVNEMNLLKSSLASYIKMFNKNNESIILINEKLLDNEIEVKREIRYYTIINPIQCYEEEHSYEIFIITYKGQKVMEFNDNVNDVLPNLNYNPENNTLVQKYKSGDWVGIFKNIISFANKYDNNLTELKVNNSAKKMIKRQIIGNTNSL